MVKLKVRELDKGVALSQTKNHRSVNPLICQQKLTARIEYLLRKYPDEILPSLSKEDLRQETWLAVMTALERYDGRKQGLQKYIDERIKGAICDVMRKEGGRFGKGRGYAVYSRYQSLLRNEGVDSLAPEEVAERLGITVEAAKRAVAYKAYEVVYFEFVGSNDHHETEVFSLLDVLHDEAAVTDEDRHYSQEISLVLARLIDKLPPVQQIIINEYYFQEKTLKQIGDSVELSESRVSYLLDKAIGKLRFQFIQEKTRPL